MRNARKSQCIGNFVGIECSNVVFFGDNTNGVGITKSAVAKGNDLLELFVKLDAFNL